MESIPEYASTLYVGMSRANHQREGSLPVATGSSFFGLNFSLLSAIKMSKLIFTKHNM